MSSITNAALTKKDSTGRRSPTKEPLASGGTLCRFLNNERCTMVTWEGRWELEFFSGTSDQYSMEMKIKGRGSTIELEMNVTPKRAEAFFVNRKVNCFFSLPYDATSISEYLAPLLGKKDAITVGSCLAGFERARPWENLNLPDHKKDGTDDGTERDDSGKQE